MRLAAVTCLGILLTGCAAGQGQALLSAPPAPVTPAPVVQTGPVPLADQGEVLRAAIGTWPQCRAEILGFIGLASLARELGQEGEVFADAIEDLSNQVADCINEKSDEDGLVWS